MDCNENPQVYSEKEANEAITLNEQQEKRLEKKVEELHSNVRHITQLGMSWYAFFVTLNYLTVGWSAKDLVSKSTNTPIIWLVAGLFFIQNALGIVGIYQVLKAVKVGAAQVSTYETLLLTARYIRRKEVLERASIPVTLYENIAWTLMIVMFSLMLAWAYMGWTYMIQVRIVRCIILIPCTR